jgi:hypothetical protein
MTADRNATTVIPRQSQLPFQSMVLLRSLLVHIFRHLGLIEHNCSSDHQQNAFASALLTAKARFSWLTWSDDDERKGPLHPIWASLWKAPVSRIMHKVRLLLLSMAFGETSRKLFLQGCWSTKLPDQMRAIEGVMEVNFSASTSLTPFHDAKNQGRWRNVQ